MGKQVRKCCNYDDGNCSALDDGEMCVCVQSISHSQLCKWFRAAVLPLDKVLCAEVMKQPDNMKRCAECGASFVAASNRAKYCPSCSKLIRRHKEAERQRKLYHRYTHLGQKKAACSKGFSSWSVRWWYNLTNTPEDDGVNA